MPGRTTIKMIVGQGPIALAVGAGGGCLDIFPLSYELTEFSGTAEIRQKEIRNLEIP